MKIKSLLIIALILACILLAWYGADEATLPNPKKKKQTAADLLKLDSLANATALKKGFNFTGLRDSINKHPHARANYSTKKLWGYIK